MSCGADNVLWNILYIQYECEEYCPPMEHCYEFE